MIKIYRFFITCIFIVFVNDLSKAEIINSSSCNQDDVQVAIDLANDGDTVFVPAGTAIWRSPEEGKPAIKIKQKSITLMGAGIDQTIIIDSTLYGWYEVCILLEGEEGKPVRITGFSFEGYVEPELIHIRGTCKNFRIDHCSFKDHTQEAVHTYGSTYGVIDHCTFTSDSSETRFRCVIVSDERFGDSSWARPLSLGTTEAVYVEDCFMDFKGEPGEFMGNIIDANFGGRYVFRYNYVINKYIEAHSGCPNGGRSTFSYEIYGNTLEAKIPTYRPFLMRGGTGVIFDNVITGDWNSVDIHVDNQRSCEDDCLDWDMCDGTNEYDGNTPGMEGYPCRDQIGRSTDGGRYAPQSLEPLYEWNNISDEGDMDIIINPVACEKTWTHIQENRDYYNDTKRPYYSPLIYPHPLVSEHSDSITSSITNNKMLIDKLELVPNPVNKI